MALMLMACWMGVLVYQDLLLSNKMAELREFEAFIMANAFPEDTGLPMIIYISPKVR